MADELSDVDGWEARMAARSRARGEDWPSKQPERDAEWDRRIAEWDRQGWAAQRDMTLGEAMDLLRVEPWACACSGGLSCCRFRYGQAFALQRAAHIVVKLISKVGGRVD